jgi:hypothetical protein
MLKKLLISPFFGQYPSWIDKYRQNCRKLKKYGWDFLIPHNLDKFSQLIKEKLGINPHITEGTCKASDFRPALGLILADYIKGYDFWGYTDLDCIYGRLDKFITDDLLTNCDIYSNDIGQMCGPMSLYRNIPEVNNLFKQHPHWQSIMESIKHHAFDEQGMGQTVQKCTGLRVHYHHWEGNNPNDATHLSFKGDSLFDGEDEIMYFHFNRLQPKKWVI